MPTFLGLKATANMEAMNAYMMNSQAHTLLANELRDSWISWYDNLGIVVDVDSVFDEGRNRRNAFNRANAVSSAEKEQVDGQIKTGMSLEQTEGKADRRNSSGNYPGPPLIPTVYKIVAAAAAAGIFVLATLKKLRII
jgi:hypothetical protein